MDLSESFASASEQLTYPDIGERILNVTVAKVVPRGDKPKDPAIHLTEFPGKPLLPGVNVGSVLRKAWGLDGKAWVGRTMTIYGDPEVFFGKDKTGGVRVSHVSHIDAPVSVPRRGKGARGQITVQPLADESPHAAELAELQALWRVTDDPDERARIEARASELRNA